MRHESLFRPIEIRGRRFANRIVFPPTMSNMAIGSEQYEWFLRTRARGGTATIIVQGTPLGHFNRPAFEEKLSGLASALKAEGAVGIVQLFLPDDVDGEPVDVSAGEGRRALTSAEVGNVPERFGMAAEMCIRAGFDGVEPHGAHGFLLNRFFSPSSNRRTDRYGGTPAKRMRLGLDITAAMRKRMGQAGLIFYRHTPVQTGEYGYTLEESCRFAVSLVEAGVDVLDISPSTLDDTGDRAALAAAVRRAAGVPVVAVGGMEDPTAAARVIDEGKADFVAICRGLIADPQWPAKVRAGATERIVECVKCNEKCFGNLREGIPISCTQNENAGREYEGNRK